MNTSELIAGLCRPEAYDHEAHTFEVLQTHISWVILTGPFAYKLKKPVDLGFVDFSTLEKRRFYCEEELRLNRRLAEDLYLGVTAVTGSPAALHMVDTATPSSAPIEYALKMRQFDQQHLASAAFERGELEPRHWDALADRLAEFHRQQPAVDLGKPLGTLAVAAKYMRTNFEKLFAAELDDAIQQTVRAVSEWTEAQLVQWSDVFAARREAGMVRECHGDLHLCNMVFLNDALVPFDCIDFNDELRWIDVQSEIAFCVMDLEDRDHRPTAYRFLNRYLEGTGDYPGLALLPLFQSYRAMVRAKVASLRLQQADLGASEREALINDCHSYIQLAAHYTRPSTPQLVLMHGPSGSGKSTWSQRLIEAAGVVRLRSDIERKRLCGKWPALVQVPREPPKETYSTAATGATYARLLDLVSETIAAGCSTVVDATFLQRAQRQVFTDWADAHRVPWIIADCHAPPDELRRRVDRRAAQGGDASDADRTILEQQLGTLEPLSPAEAASAISLADDRPEDFARLVRRLGPLA